jgi:hypothetical protein
VFILLRLNLETQPIKLNYSIKNAAYEAHSTPAALNMHTQPVIVEIKQPQGELSIDSRPFYASLQIYDSATFARKNAELGKETALETIGKIAEEGDRLGKIESGENAVANIAKDKLLTPPPDVTFAPLNPPSVTYKANPPEFHVIPARVDVDYIPGKFDVTYQPGSFSLHITQYPSIKMWTSDNKYDRKA